MARDLSKLNTEEFEKFMNSFDHVFLDIDGVVWFHNGELYEGVKESIAKLIELNKNIHFVTNNHSAIRHDVFNRLVEIVPNLTPNDVITPISAMVKYLKDIEFDKEICYFGPTFCVKKFIEAGLKVANLTTDSLGESIESAVANGKDNKSVGVVIYDFDPQTTYTKLNKAVAYLQRNDVLFFSGNPEFSASVDGVKIIGPAAFVNLLEQITGRKAVSFAKPSKVIGNYLLSKFNIRDKGRSLFIGDTLYHDILLGNQIGFQTVLVLTGTSQLSHIDCNGDDNLLPKYVLGGFGNLYKLIEEKFTAQYSNNNTVHH